MHLQASKRGRGWDCAARAIGGLHSQKLHALGLQNTPELCWLCLQTSNLHSRERMQVCCSRFPDWLPWEMNSSRFGPKLLWRKKKTKTKQRGGTSFHALEHTCSAMYNILVLTFVDRTFGQSVMELVLPRKPVCSSRAYQEQQQQSKVGEMTHFQNYFHILFENSIYLHSVFWLYLSFSPAGPS